MRKYYPLGLSKSLTLLGLLGTACLFPGAPRAHSDPALNAMQSKMMSGPSMRGLRQASGKAFEIAFLSEMIEHHMGAVQMAQSAVRGADRADVKAAAQKVVEDQTKEIGQMTSWLKAWYGRSPDPNLRARMKRESAPMMAKFRADCRKDCDMAFLMHMKAHHQSALPMAQLAVKKGVHSDLRAFASHIVSSQTREIKEFETMMHSGMTHGGGHH